MATKAELGKAFDAGQAAQLYNVPDEACPFEEGTDEYDEYMKGKGEELAEKWTSGSRQITQEIVN